MIFRALPTVYNGYRFRSRLEARWAVFFDALGLAYRYEPEGFSLPPCRRADCWAHGTAAGPVRQEERAFAYLPDFYLPTLATWVEIKPAAPSEEELEKLMRLHCHTGQAAVLLAGDCADTNSYDRPPAYVGYVPGTSRISGRSASGARWSGSRTAGWATDWRIGGVARR